MITLKVFFVNNNELGTATLIENLITNDVMLELSSKLLIGETKAFIEKAVKNSSNYNENLIEIVNVNNMEEAVRTAVKHCVSGDIVSLSPASASFGLYKNFEERGNHFKSIVNDLK